MKTITIIVPTYNEEANITLAYDEITRVIENELLVYNCEILFVDNFSTDNTRNLIEVLCKKDLRVKAIFYAKNFGMMKSFFYAFTQAEGDCAILIHADLQNPPTLIPEFIKHWENGAKVVIGIKKASKENPLMFFLRTCYYKVMKMTSDIEHIEHFSDFELLDRDFLNIIKELDDPFPYLRGIVSELGFRIKKVHYNQNKRERGKTSANFRARYEYAMNGITSYSKSIIRVATITGFIFSVICIILALSVLVIKIFNWDKFSAGIASIAVGVFTLGAIQLFYIGLLGEYILNINTRIMKRPLVIEEKLINFD